nr:MAG TPA: hypothetical protein [Caudoviricetes sp.]
MLQWNCAFLYYRPSRTFSNKNKITITIMVNIKEVYYWII